VASDREVQFLSVGYGTLHYYAMYLSSALFLISFLVNMLLLFCAAEAPLQEVLHKHYKCGLSSSVTAPQLVTRRGIFGTPR
jgi:hypothetical protein